MDALEAKCYTASKINFIVLDDISALALNYKSPDCDGPTVAHCIMLRYCTGSSTHVYT